MQSLNKVVRTSFLPSVCSTTFPAVRVVRFFGLVCALISLTGCTAGWQAPLESRSTDTRTRQAVPIPRSATAYRVRRGDTLVAIAWRAGLDWRQLAQWNGLVAPYTILPGQMLRLRPLPAKPLVRARKPPRSAIPPDTRSALRQTQSVPKPARQKSAASSPKRRLVWRWPTDGSVTAGYAVADPARKGIKVAGTLGQPIRAAEQGSVVYSGSGLIGYGQLIIIKHNDKYLSAYGNNRKILVKEGDQVTKGQRIAEMGRANGGRAILHFEIRREGEPVNPLSLLPPKRP